MNSTFFKILNVMLHFLCFFVVVAFEKVKGNSVILLGCRQTYSVAVTFPDST